VNKPPAFQFYVEKWLSSPDIQRMSPAQELAYFRLLLYQWDSPDCRLPNDPKTLAAMVRMTDAEWAKESPPILAKFVVKNQFIFNKILRSQHNRLLIYRKEKSEAGVKGMRKRWVKTRDITPLITHL
jgi:uncharacterized protein YdaU (DUF1376 family)